MPAMLCCNRRWLAGSDDFVLQGFRYAFVHLVLIVIGAALLAQNNSENLLDSKCLALNPHAPKDGKQGDGPNEIHIGVSALVATNALIAFEFLVLGAVSCRGRILEASKRTLVPVVIAVLVLTDILQVAASAYSIHYVYVENADSLQAFCVDVQRNSIHALVIISLVVSIYWVVCLFFMIDPHGGIGTNELVAPGRYQKLWVDRCRRAYCCFVSYEEYASEIEGVAVIMKNLFQAHDIVLTDIVAGFTLIRGYQRGMLEERARQLGRDGTLNMDTVISRQAVPLIPLTDADQSVLRDIRHFSKYYLAVYGWWLHVFQYPITGLPEVCCKSCSLCCSEGSKHGVHDADWCGCNNASLRLAAQQLRDEDVLYMFYDNTFLNPCFLVVVDEPSKHLVISVRGTMSNVDCLTDGLAEPVPIAISELSDTQCLVHRGFFESARNIRERLLADEKCNAALKGEGPLGDYNIMITGHSLGAGVAAVLTLLLREGIESVRRRARAIVYAPPGGLMSRELSEYSASFIVACFMGKDLVPRLSNHSIKALRDAMFYAIAATNRKKVEIIGRSLCPTPGLVPHADSAAASLSPEERETLRCLLESRIDSDSVMATPRDQYAVRVPSATECLLRKTTSSDVAPEAVAPTGSNSPFLNVRLYPPSRIMHYHRVASSKNCCAFCCLPRGTKSCCTKLHYYPQWTSIDNLQEIYCSPLMVADHLPDRFFSVIEDVARAFEDKSVEQTIPKQLGPDNRRDWGAAATAVSPTSPGLMYGFALSDGKNVAA